MNQEGVHFGGPPLDRFDGGGDAARLAEEVSQAERQVIARELHDTVIQPLTALTISFESIQYQALPPGVLEAYLSAWRELAQEALDSLRGTLSGLRTHPHAYLGLPEALRRYLAPHLRSRGICLSLEDRDWPTDLPLNLTSALYLAVREALTNVEKHAHASEASVWMHGGTRSLDIVVSDNGVGVCLDEVAQRPHDRDGNGFGLTGMRDRLNALGGQMWCRSAPGQGTSIIFLVPSEPEPQAVAHAAEKGTATQPNHLVH